MDRGYAIIGSMDVRLDEPRRIPADTGNKAYRFRKGSFGMRKIVNRVLAAGIVITVVYLFVEYYLPLLIQ